MKTWVMSLMELDKPRGQEVSLDLHLPNGTTLVVMKSLQRTFIKVGLEGRLPLVFDVTLPGCPFEQAIWAMEKKWPDRCRG